MSASLKLILIRGLPGSGKSTRARSLDAFHVEADMYFVNSDGDYCFDPALLPKAHEWCQNRAEDALKQGNDVVVSNTFVKRWEMKAYRNMARRHGAELVIEVCREQYGNIHGVPESVVKRMKKEWQE